MKVAVIAYHYPESSLPLAKYLADNGNHVDYYYITDCKTRSISAFDFSRVKSKLGITKLRESDIPEIYTIWKGNKAHLHLIRFYWLPFKFFPFVKRILQRWLMYPTLKRLNKRNYDAINLIGQNTLLKYIDQKLTCKVKVHSLHEVAPHYSEQKISKKFIEFLLNNKIPVIVHSNTSYKAIHEYSLARKNSNIFEIPFGLFETYLSIKPGNAIPFSDYLLFYGWDNALQGLGFAL